MTSPAPPRSVSQTIGAHVAGLDYYEIPSAASHQARRALLDSLGVMLGATGLSPEATPYHTVALSAGGGSMSRLLSGGDASPEHAAFANGALSHALDFGDVFDLGPAHPNAALVPALIALADADPLLSSEEFLTAMVIGSDLACRFSLAGHRTFEEGGWYPPPLVGSLGAAAGCAKLLGLDADGVVQAIGLALCSASFPGEIKFDPASPIRAVREAFAARAAVSAAQLAEAGARAFAAPLEGRAGFFALYTGGLNADRLLDGLGERYMGAELSFKPWPSCRGTHAYIEAALLLREHCSPEDIDSIEAEIGLVQDMLVSPPAAKMRPDSSIAAKFSIPFTVAVALIEGAIGLDSFDDAHRSDPQILDLASRLSSRLNPSWGHKEASSGSLTLLLKDGRKLTHAVPHARGHPGNPISDAELIAKFAACTARAQSPWQTATAEQVANRILNMKCDDLMADILDEL
jgi:2-methylcitrate dehydratase PrpD